jgi:hypothetical protein
MSALDKLKIHKLLTALDEQLRTQEVKGEIYLVGGAVMCLVLEARESTVDLDALFEPTAHLRQAAAIVARDHGVSEDWLNDAVKGFLSPEGGFNPYLDLSNLAVFVAQPDYLLAMKCLAMRLGAEFHDEDDVRYLLRYLNIESYEVALTTITKFYPESRFPPKTRYALQEILGS